MKRAIIVAACAVLLTGCGTITRGNSEDVAINVTPSNADVRLSNGRQCQGSCVVNVSRKESFTVTASAPGYEPQSVAVGVRVSGGGGASMAGNILLGGIIGAGVDTATGAALDHHPNPVNINLQPAGRQGQRRQAVPTS